MNSPSSERRTGHHRQSAYHLLARALADSVGRARLPVSGDCMAPLLCGDEHVHVQSARDPLTPGDLVVAQGADGTIICHRVLAVDSSQVWLAGDVSGRIEPHASQSILGRVCAIERKGQIRELGSPTGFDRALAQLRFWAFRRAGTHRSRIANALHRRLLTLYEPLGHA